MARMTPVAWGYLRWEPIFPGNRLGNGWTCFFARALRFPIGNPSCYWECSILYFLLFSQFLSCFSLSPRWGVKKMECQESFWWFVHPKSHFPRNLEKWWHVPPASLSVVKPVKLSDVFRTGTQSFWTCEVHRCLMFLVPRDLGDCFENSLWIPECWPASGDKGLKKCVVLRAQRSTRYVVA